MRSWAMVLGPTAALVGALAMVSCGGGGSSGGASMATTTTTSGFVATSLVSNINSATNPYSGSNADRHLVNAWGIAFNPQGFVWVANNGTSTSTLYDGAGVPQSLVVSIPAGSKGPAKPTGIVFNGSPAFQVSEGGASGASVFMFAGEGGTISGWSPAVNMTNAIVAVDNGAKGKIYKGLALAGVGGAPRLYAADFHNGVVDVFDGNFAPVVVGGAFVDPSLPAGYAPFGIQAIGSQIFVSYAKQDAQGEDDVAGSGLGAVDVFDTAGHLVQRLIPVGGKLDAPWGMVMAPADFGPFGNDLLVGNFGDGKINVFDPVSGAFIATLSNGTDAPLVFDGLWGLAFGNGINSQPTNTLFYAAGPADESNGAYGRIDFH